MIRAAALWLALAGAAGAEGFPALYDVVGVNAGDVLNIRAAPDAAAAIVGNLPPGAKGVEVVGTSADGLWAVVNAGERTGHARLRFLARQPGPDWFALQTPLTCLGTEPFWSLAYTPADPIARFATPDGEAPFEVLARWPGAAHHGVAGLALGDRRHATLRAGACSDGMSERNYGISAILFLMGGEGPVTLHGCCTLQP